MCNGCEVCYFDAVVGDLPINGLDQWQGGAVGGEEYRKVVVVMDSGAGCSVAPRNLANDGKIKASDGSKRGQKFTCAGGKIIQNEGEVSLDVVSETGNEMRAKFQVADVTRPLLSVAAICDKGNYITMGPGGGRITNMATKRETYFRRDNGIYVLDLWVKKSDTGF